MDERLVLKLIELVEKSSPALWAIARRQVMVDVLQGVVFLVMMAILAVVIWYAADEFVTNYERLAIKWALVIVIALFMVVVVTASVGRLMNPDYYAMRKNPWWQLQRND